MGYTKLFNEIIMSTVWREPNHVRLLWITMLALKDQYHTVNASLPGLADAARITMDECKQALDVLTSPDPFSRSKEFEGRRIDVCDGGWLILNGEKYKQKMSLEERREYKKIKQREYRAKKLASSVDNSVDKCNKTGTLWTHTEEEEEEEEKNVTENNFSDDDLSLAQEMYTSLLTLNPKQKKPNFDKWANTIRLIRERDDKAINEIKSLWIWANNNDFWQKNILSPEKLRKKWDTLIIQQGDKKHENYADGGI